MKDEPRSPVPLLTFAHDDGVAAVCRDQDDGSLWLTAELDSEEWWDLEGYGIADEDTDRVRAFAGRLPPGASAAELRDLRDDVHQAAIGHGVWLLVVSRSVQVEPTTVLFRDAEGAILPVPQPPAASAEPIPDADVPCPACHGREWDLVTRPERDGTQAEQMICCRRCGHEALAYFGPKPIMPELPPSLQEPLEKASKVLGGIARLAVGKWEEYALDVDFPVYGLGPEWKGARSVANVATSGFGRAYLVGLLHGGPDVASAPAVLVETAREPDERLAIDELVTETLRQGLEAIVPHPHEEPTPSPLSDPARQLIEHIRELGGDNEAARRAAVAKRSQATLIVDGQGVEFLVAEAEGFLAAAAAIGELDVTLLSRGVPVGDIELRTIELSDYQRDPRHGTA